ncbi:LamG-like jellyroll fold domain-containing protein [Streptosporangium longisporum]|uniref:LamG-like jellyroll fold domain-containing protein n=1 Tax=Streptosporangium longisporum TaxID=46187 RepID=UPI0031F0DF62
MDTAIREAKKQNKRVEIESYRAENSTTFANPNGKTLYTELHSTPIRVQKNGTWQPIDTTLVEENGVIKPKAAKGDLILSAGGDTALVKVKGDKGEAVISAATKLPKPQLSGNTATYPSAYGQGVDLVITASPTGFQQEIVIRQRPTTALKVRVPVALPKGMSYGKDSSGHLALLADKGKKEIADITAAPMEDAAAAKNPDTGRTGTAPMTVDQKTAGQALVITPDSGFLNDPAVTYPVTMAIASDTWTGTGIDGDTYINSGTQPNSSNNKNKQDLIAGMSNTGSVAWRAFIRFNIAGTPLMGGTVENADLRLWNHDSNTCDSQINSGILAQPIVTDWNINTMTWSTQPQVTASAQVANKGAYDASCPNRGEGELYYSIETMVQGWMDGQKDYGVRLRSVSESDLTNWRWYRSYEYGDWGTGSPRGPVLFVNYQPGTIEEDVVIPTLRSDPSAEGPIPYEEAIAGELQAYPAPPSAQDVTPEQAQTNMEQATDTYEINTEDLLPLPEEEPPTSDETSPSVIDTVPSPGAKNVITNTSVQITFDEPVSGVIVTVKGPGGAAVTGSLVMAGENRTAIFTPNQALTAENIYTAEVTSAQDSSGNSMTAPYSWSFTTLGLTPTPVPGLVAAYGMEETSGNAVTDSSGQNNNGTASNTNQITSGKYGKALSFNGATSWVTVNNADSLQLTTGMTLSAWVNPTTVTGWRTVVMKEYDSGGASYGLYASNGSTPSGWLQTSGNASEVDGTTPLPGNIWSHVAATYDGANARLYVNGALVGEETVTGNLISDDSPLRIGGNARWGEYFNGLIDEVRIYNLSQTAAQIQADMNNPVTGSAPALTIPNRNDRSSQQPSTADTAAAPATFPYNRVDWPTCNKDLLAQVKRARANGTSAVGHTTNPYNWCAAQAYAFPVYKRIVRTTGQVVSEQWKGQVNFSLAARAYTYAGGKKGSNGAETDKPSGKNSRDITFAWRIIGVRYQGDLTYFNPMMLRAGLTTSSHCQVKNGPQDGGTAGKNSLFTTWASAPEAEWTINSPKNTGTGKNLISACMIVPTLRYTSPVTNATPGGDVTRDISIQYPVVRCDTSELIEKYTGGCIFTDVSPVLIFDATKNVGIKESTKHVWDAYYHPEWTYPLLAGKKVPGRAPNGLLHRTVEGAVPGLEDPDEAPSGTIKANRDHSISKCREKWPMVNPKPDGLDCDEFPFASTMEGSLSANGNYSVRYISNSDNRTSGNQLGVFYQRMRRLGQDPFWVFANPLAADRDQQPPRWP